MDHSLINLLHILFVAPLLIAVGYNAKKSSDMLFNLTLVLGIVVLLYHAYIYFFKKPKESFTTLNNNVNNANNMNNADNVPQVELESSNEVSVGVVGDDVGEVSGVTSGTMSEASVETSGDLLQLSSDSGNNVEEIEGFSW